MTDWRSDPKVMQARKDFFAAVMATLAAGDAFDVDGKLDALCEALAASGPGDQEAEWYRKGWQAGAALGPGRPEMECPQHYPFGIYTDQLGFPSGLCCNKAKWRQVEPGGEAVACVIAELREAAANTDFSRADMRWFESMANRLTSTQGVQP